jgi:hypothetical protein
VWSLSYPHFKCLNSGLHVTAVRRQMAQKRDVQGGYRGGGGILQVIPWDVSVFALLVWEWQQIQVKLTPQRVNDSYIYKISSKMVKRTCIMMAPVVNEAPGRPILYCWHCPIRLRFVWDAEEEFWRKLIPQNRESRICYSLIATNESARFLKRQNF